MRRGLTVLCGWLLMGQSLSAFCSPSCSCGSDWPSDNNYEVDVGFRQDKLQWSIPGMRLEDGSYFPSTLSKLTWKEIRSVQVAASGRYVSCRNYALKFSGDYGWIYHGRNTDIDYAGNHQTDIFSYSSNNAGKGCVYDVSGAVGYRLTSTGGRCLVTPYLGYSFHAQDLHMYDGEQEICFDPETRIPCPIGPIEGLNSAYKAQWVGPWIGIDFITQVERCAYLFGGIEWHFVHFSANGNWNLRTDIGPFHQSASGQGGIATLGANWEIWRHWSIGIVANYRNFRTSKGTEKITILEPEEDSGRFSFRFKGASWTSGDISGLVSVRF